MQLGMVGLGKMGGNMVARICHSSDHEVIGYDPNPDVVADAVAEGATGVSSLADLVSKLAAPRLVWIMVPAGSPTQGTVDALAKLLEPGDTIIDGGNSKWTDDQIRHETLRKCGIHYVDVGTSGGIHGLRNGYCMMVGGNNKPVNQLMPIFDVLAPQYGIKHGPGWLHVGPSGAGHYTKMIHNGIEYGMMQAIAEGFAMFDACEFPLDNAAIAHLWMRGSVVRSWLLELAAAAFDNEGNNLADLEPHVDDSGEGRWTVEDSINRRVPLPVITAALQARFASRGRDDFAAKVNAALRAQFGGHAVTRKE